MSAIPQIEMTEIDSRTFRPAPDLSPERRQHIEDIVSGTRVVRKDIIGQSLGEDVEARQALLRLLLHVDRFIDVLKPGNFSPRGRRGHRRLLDGLIVVAFHHRQWLRPVEDWACEPSINGHPRPIDQFSGLLRHLFAKYDIPLYLDAAFFEGLDEEARRHQAWFLDLACGASVRSLDTPIELTKRMAHLFMTIPGHNRHAILRNMRWAQIIGMGGDTVLAKTILSTRLGRQFEDDTFWSTVVLFLVNNAMMEPERVGPLADYIHNMKYAPRRIVLEEGGVEEGPPPHPNLSMKGRSASKLLRQVEAWHGHLARESDVVFQSWQPCGLRPFETSEMHDPIGDVRWTVQELQSSWELAAEGRAMNHCVVSYSDQCADGKTSVWSIAAQKKDAEERESVMTVAVDVRSREMTQARGKYNALPNQRPKSAQARREEQTGYFDLLNRSDHILRLWMERERITRAK
jgi:hypothetical protein